MDDSSIQYNSAKLLDQSPLTASWDPEATTKTNIDIKVKPCKDADAESLKESDLEDMMDSSVESESEETP